MDEKDITELYNTDQYINELHLDHSAQVLYWAISREIWSMGVDGSNPIVLLQLPNSIDRFAQWNNLVYWADNSGIHSITKDGSSITTLVESLDATCYNNYQHTRYRAIAIISGNKQQPGTLDLELSPTSTTLHSHACTGYIHLYSSSTGPNPCGDDNGGCSKLCLLSAVDPRGYTCADEGTRRIRVYTIVMVVIECMSAANGLSDSFSFNCSDIQDPPLPLPEGMCGCSE